MTNRTLTTAAQLNRMIQDQIDSLASDADNWHSGVYLQSPDKQGCNWNIAVNCNRDAVHCGASVSAFLDRLRSEYIVAPDDPDVIPAYGSRRSARDAADASGKADAPRTPTAGESPDPSCVR